MADSNNGSDTTSKSGDSKRSAALKAFGQSAQESGQRMLQASQEQSARAADSRARRNPGLTERQMAKPGIAIAAAGRCGRAEWPDCIRANVCSQRSRARRAGR